MTGVKSGFKNVDSQLQQMDEIKLRIDQKMAAKVKEANAWAAAQKKWSAIWLTELKTSNNKLLTYTYIHKKVQL